MLKIKSKNWNGGTITKVVFGPDGTYFVNGRNGFDFCLQGSIADYVNKQKAEEGRNIEDIAVGVNGNYWVKSDDRSRAWDLDEYP